MFSMRSNPKGGAAEQFMGPVKKYGPKLCKLPRSHFEDTTVLVGDLVRSAPEGGMMCVVPTEACKECNMPKGKWCYKHTHEVDIFKQKLIDSKKKPIVISNASGTMVMVVSGDCVTDQYPSNISKAEAINSRRRNLVQPELNLDSSLNKAQKLHQAFHGIPFDQADKYPIKKIDVEKPDKLYFFGWLKHIIYDVPKYSAREGVPFIHEGQDRGDDKPRAKEKPYVCISPKRDYCVIYGSQFEFGPRGMIG